MKVVYRNIDSLKWHVNLKVTQTPEKIFTQQVFLDFKDRYLHICVLEIFSTKGLSKY